MREVAPNVEMELWYGTAEAFAPYRPRNPKRRTRNGPFMVGVLENPLPPHFKPMSYEYDRFTDPEDHMEKFKNMALLYKYTEGVKY